MAVKKVGVLALQGAFAEHVQIVRKLGHDANEVRLPEDLDALDSLIIPGGESTAIYKLAKDYNLIDPIISFAKTKPVWGTCAGLILIASEISNQVNGEIKKETEKKCLSLIDITAQRNAFGRQQDSFVTDITIQSLEDSDHKFPAVFIRAPIIDRVGEGVEVIASLPEGQTVAARQANIFASCFHPELTYDTRMHEYFLGF